MDILKHIEELRGAESYKNFLRVRDAVLKMRAVPLDRTPEIARPSDYWAEELDRFLYMFDASPLIVEKLRHHCYHITGIQAYAYRTGADRKEGPKFADKLAALKALDANDMFVPEARAFGGFGHEIDSRLVNIDTLKFYECMLAMERGGALAALRRAHERQVVMEVGSGWGGLAYTFKTLFPNVCYVLADFPELFLFSATYLLSMFPEAKVAFVTGNASDIEGNWSDYDFVFVPNALFNEIKPERLDLTLNTVSFQEMTTEQVRAYVQKVASLGCPMLYSLNRMRSLYATQLTDVHAIIGEAYWVNEIPMLTVPYTKMLDTTPKGEKDQIGARWKDVKPPRKGAYAKTKGKAKAPREQNREKEDLGYKHVVAWRRYGEP